MIYALTDEFIEMICGDVACALDHFHCELGLGGQSVEAGLQCSPAASG
jgi:hypothetical protein